jgi:hypothetical protein
MTSRPGTAARTKYKCAVVPYDVAFKRRLATAIARAIIQVSRVGDANMFNLHTSETRDALLSVAAVVEDFAARADPDGGGSA